MKQQTLAMAANQGAGFEQYRRRTKREDFLDAMNAIVPWTALCAVIEPHYPKAGNGRPPIGLERMLRIHLLQHWFNLADNALEEALYDIASLRRFAGIDLGVERVPDETKGAEVSAPVGAARPGQEALRRSRPGAASQWFRSRPAPSSTPR
jgi:transposase, IS5 family